MLWYIIDPLMIYCGTETTDIMIEWWPKNVLLRCHAGRALCNYHGCGRKLNVVWVG